MFSTLPETNFNFSVTFILLSANAFNLDQSKILLFGKELNNDCMAEYTVFNAAFNSILVISQRPLHLSMLSWSSFNQYSAQILPKPLAAFQHIISIIKTMDSS